MCIIVEIETFLLISWLALDAGVKRTAYKYHELHVYRLWSIPEVNDIQYVGNGVRKNQQLEAAGYESVYADGAGLFSLSCTSLGKASNRDFARVAI